MALVKVMFFGIKFNISYYMYFTKCKNYNAVKLISIESGSIIALLVCIPNILSKNPNA